MKAAPALATGYFRVRPAAEFLRGTFSSVWVHQMPETGAPPIIITPDATIDLQWIDATFRIAGPDKDPLTENIPAGTTIVGFRFRPGAAANWLKVPATEILGQRLTLRELWGSKARQLADNVRDQEDVAKLIPSLEAIIAKGAPEQQATDVPMRAAYDLIRSGPPPGVSLVPWLGRALAMSERTLRRRFDASFGYGPKTLDRILRYQRFLRLARTANESTAVLAVEAGYSDQAHLVRESRRLTGSTPLQLERMMRGGGEGDVR